MIAYKFLREDGRGRFTEFLWPLPERDGPGAWVDAPVELAGEIVEERTKAVASRPEGPALLGFVAARIAEERDGVRAYHAERARQQAWLAERLGL